MGDVVCEKPVHALPIRPRCRTDSLQAATSVHGNVRRRVGDLVPGAEVVVPVPDAKPIGEEAGSGVEAHDGGPEGRAVSGHLP
jgi:hypothetical protein